MARQESAWEKLQAAAADLSDAERGLRDARLEANLARNRETDAGNRREATLKAFDAAIEEYRKAVANG